MAIDIKVPSVGESITEGTIARWLKQNGELVRAAEPLFELETEKATTEVPAPVAGKLSITTPQGKTVAVGAVIGQIDPSAAATDPPQPETKPPPQAKKVDGQVNAQERPLAGPAASRADIPSSPSVRRLAQEKGIELGQVRGTGGGGRITKEDLLTHAQKLEQPTPSPSPAPAPVPPVGRSAALAPGQRESRQPMSSIRQRIAERLITAQQTAAILTTFNEADLSAVIDLRGRYKELFKEKHGVGLGFMSFFVKAVVQAIQDYPLINAWIDGNDIVMHHYCNIGVAVSTEYGLLVPVLRDAEQMSLAQIESKIAELSKKARERKISVDDLQGGTFTITNGGVFGSLMSTPILNPPQSAILGMHAIQKRPVAVNDQVVIRPMMYLALSYDHRLVDGRDAVLFLVRVKECVENPERLLLGV